MPLSSEGYISPEAFNKMLYSLEVVPVTSCRNVVLGLVRSKRKILKLTREIAFHIRVLFVCLKPMFWVVFLLNGVLYVFTKESAPFFLWQ